MAITISANFAKKMPIPGTDFSSQQASITITAEVTDLNQVAAEAQKLYSIAERAVDAQLSQSPTQQATVAPSPTITSSNPAPGPTSAHAPRQGASQPYRPTQQRRGPAPITDSQLRFLDRLITQTGASLPAILEHHQIGSLRDLSCKSAAGLIDELKVRVPA